MMMMMMMMMMIIVIIITIYYTASIDIIISQCITMYNTCTVITILGISQTVRTRAQKQKCTSLSNVTHVLLIFVLS